MVGAGAASMRTGTTGVTVTTGAAAGPGLGGQPVMVCSGTAGDFGLGKGCWVLDSRRASEGSGSPGAGSGGCRGGRRRTGSCVPSCRHGGGLGPSGATPMRSRRRRPRAGSTSAGPEPPYRAPHACCRLSRRVGGLLMPPLRRRAARSGRRSRARRRGRVHAVRCASGRRAGRKASSSACRTSGEAVRSTDEGPGGRCRRSWRGWGASP